MKQLLTTKYVDALKPKGQRIVISDLGCPNLVLIVHTTGRKAWSWRGRLLGKLRNYTLGRYPIHSLHSAREWAREVNRQRDLGVDIIAERARLEGDTAAKSTRTCDWLFEQYMIHQGGLRASASEKWRLYRREVAPYIGNRCVDDIRHNDLANILQRKLAESGSVSNAVQRLIKTWFAWSVGWSHLTGLEMDPAAHLPKLAPIKSRDRYLTDYKIGLLFQALSETCTAMSEPLKLILYTGVRRAEAFELPWEELEALDDGIWLIPGSRTKNGVDHLIPLPLEMVEMLQRKRRGTSGGLVWPGGGAEGRPMSGFSKVVGALNVRMESIANLDGRTVKHWSTHDLRRTVSSGMSALHDDQDRPLIEQVVIDRVLNHVIPGVRGTYNRHAYRKEKKTALRLWADHLAKLFPRQHRQGVTA